MKKLLALAMSLGLAVFCAGLSFSQSAASKGKKPAAVTGEDQEDFVEEESPEEPEAGADEAPKAGPKESGNVGKMKSYLNNRLNQYKHLYEEQRTFGKKMNSDWQEFWKKIFDERNIFEVRMAKQRLNVLDSLGSLSQAAHSQTISDFERLESNQIKSFETSQKDAISSFVNKFESDLKMFFADQERQRSEFVSMSLSSWDALKKAEPEKPARKKAEKSK
jgi:hypothetical protein